jgi:hypothetical protein
MDMILMILNQNYVLGVVSASSIRNLIIVELLVHSKVAEEIDIVSGSAGTATSKFERQAGIARKSAAHLTHDLIAVTVEDSAVGKG